MPANKTKTDKFANPLPNDKRARIGQLAQGMTIMRLTLDPVEAEKEVECARWGHLVLPLTHETYDRPQDFLNAMDAYESACKRSGFPSVDIVTWVDSYLQDGKKAAEALLAQQGIFQTGKRQWVATVPSEEGTERRR